MYTAYEIPYPIEVVQVLSGVMPSFEIVSPHMWVLATYATTHDDRQYHMVVWKWFPYSGLTSRIRLSRQMYLRGFIHKADHYIWLTAFASDVAPGTPRPPLFTQIILDLSDPSLYGIAATLSEAIVG